MNRLLMSSLVLPLLGLPTVACSAGHSPDGGSSSSSTSWSSGDDDRPGVTPQGTGGERRFPVADFQAVGLGTSADVDIRVGPSFSVVASGESAALDKLRIRRDGDTLEIDQKRGSMHTTRKLRIAITMPRITGASIGGSGSITVDRVEGDRFKGSIGGSGRLDVNGIKVDRASFSIGGSGDITAAGTARSTDVSLGGSGNVRAAGLTSDHAEVTIAGAGDVQANASKTAEVNIVGSGDVTITGGAHCDVTKMGSGTVRCG